MPFHNVLVLLRVCTWHFPNATLSILATLHPTVLHPMVLPNHTVFPTCTPEHSHNGVNIARRVILDMQQMTSTPYAALSSN